MILTRRLHSLPPSDLYAKFTSDTPYTRNESLRPDELSLNIFTIPLDSKLSYATSMLNSDYVKCKHRAEGEGVKYRCNGLNVITSFTLTTHVEGAQTPAAIGNTLH